MNRMLFHHLVERLGWTLVHSTWQVVIIAAAYLLSRCWLRSPQTRHGAAMLALIASLAWPISTFWSSTVSSTQPRAAATLASSPQALFPANSATAASEAATKSQRALPITISNFSHAKVKVSSVASPHLMRWAVQAWLAGVMLLTLRQGLALWSLYRLRTRAVQEAPAAIRVLSDQIKIRLGLHRTVKLAVSARAVVPIVIGSLRPVVLLPASLLSGLPTAQIEALLAHELAHLRRWDDLANWLQCMVETLLFYHPAIWWLNRCAREERELCCDDLATAQGIERRTLAKALGQLALWQAQPALAATGHMPVLARIQRLLQPPPTQLPVNQGPWLLILSSLMLIGWMSHAQAEMPPRGRILDRNGVVLAESPKPGERHYPFKSLAAHVIGYVGDTTPQDLTLLTGRSGIEQSANDELTAKRDVQLTLNATLQQSVEAALEEQAKGGGAAVILDATNGDVLVMASNPGYDLNTFVPRIDIKQFEALSKDERHPLLGRAFLGNYFPGSTSKLITALAGLKSGAITEQTTFEGLPSLQIGDRTFRNWNKTSDGPLDVSGAIMRSSNTWFYQVALKMGTQPFLDLASDFGLGQPTGLPMRSEAKGFLPTNELYQQRYGHGILPGTLASLSIGQIMEISPLQAAVVAAAIGNGGKVFSPRLLTSQPAGVIRTDLTTKGLKPAHLERVKEGLMACVSDPHGVAHNAYLAGTSIAGITGTTQWHVYEDASKNRSLGWFVGFAPAQNPKIAIALVYEGQPGERLSGGMVCAPLAKQMIEQWLKESPLNGTPR